MSWRCEDCSRKLDHCQKCGDDLPCTSSFCGNRWQDFCDNCVFREQRDRELKKVWARELVEQIANENMSQERIVAILREMAGMPPEPEQCFTENEDQ